MKIPKYLYFISRAVGEHTTGLKVSPEEIHIYLNRDLFLDACNTLCHEGKWVMRELIYDKSLNCYVTIHMDDLSETEFVNKKSFLSLTLWDVFHFTARHALLNHFLEDATINPSIDIPLDVNTAYLVYVEEVHIIGYTYSSIRIVLKSNFQVTGPKFIIDNPVRKYAIRRFAFPFDIKLHSFDFEEQDDGNDDFYSQWNLNNRIYSYIDKTNATIPLQRKWRDILNIRKAKLELQKRRICSEIRALPGIGIDFQNAQNKYSGTMKR